MNLNLSKTSGLPISLKNDRLVFNGLISFPVQTRTLKEARAFLKEKSAKAGREKLYLMYRDVRRVEDEKLLRRKNLRYDITVIFPAVFGKEFSKTIGHYHPYKKGTKTPYPEIYEVLAGKAFFLFQEKNLNRSYLKKIGGEKRIFGKNFLHFRENPLHRAYLIETKKGEKIIVPPGFGHVTVNASKDPLIVSNVSADHFKSEYGFFRTHRGGAYYLVKDGKRIRVERNPNYRQNSLLFLGSPKKIKGLNKPLYKILTEKPGALAFLNNPEKHKKFLEPKKLFKISKS